MLLHLDKPQPNTRIRPFSFPPLRSRVRLNLHDDFQAFQRADDRTRRSTCCSTSDKERDELLLIDRRGSIPSCWLCRCLIMIRLPWFDQRSLLVLRRRWAKPMGRRRSRMVTANGHSLRSCYTSRLVVLRCISRGRSPSDRHGAKVQRCTRKMQRAKRKPKMRRELVVTRTMAGLVRFEPGRLHFGTWNLDQSNISRTRHKRHAQTG